MTSQLVEVACGIALSESRKKKQTLLFRGDTECDVTRNLLTALKNICGKYDSKLDAKLEILHIFHQKADNSEGSDVPYYFKIIRNCDGDEFEFQFKNSSIFEYSHELLLPAALMYGASVELSSKMRISEVNSLKIPIQMKHPSSFYKQFISEVRKAFLELNLGNHMNFIWTVTAAILHIRSGNWTIAEELLGVGKNSLEESLDRIYSDKTTFCNALFHTTAEMIIGDALGRQSRKWEETGEEAVSLIGVVQKYSRGTDWMDFCSNYQSDLLQLMQNMEELSVPIPTNTSGGTKNDTSVINDFTRGTKELKFLVTKKDYEKLKIYHLHDIIEYQGNFSSSYDKFVAARKCVEKFLIKSRWNQLLDINADELILRAFNHDIWENYVIEMEQRLEAIKTSNLRSLHCKKEESVRNLRNVFCLSPENCNICKSDKHFDSKVQIHKIMLQDNTEDLDIKSPVKIKIKELIEKNALDLMSVQALIVQSFNIELSQLDVSFISKKYVKYCLQIWLADSLKICENIGSQNFQEYLDALDNFNNLTGDVPSIFSFSRYFTLVQNIGSLIPRTKERECVSEFKTECKRNLLKLNEKVKKELEFIQSFVAYIRSFKNVKKLVESLKLMEFCTGNISFDEFRAMLIESDSLQGELGCLAAMRIKGLCEASQFSQIDKLKNFIVQYIKPAKLRTILNDGHYFLEGKCMVLELSFIKSLLVDHCKANNKINEIRLIVGDTLYLDADIECDVFHGQNFVIWCRRLVVSNEKVKIDVSGLDSNKIYSSNAGNLSDGTGRNGADGYAGQSGGNILLIADEVVNAFNLRLISNGGKGGRGQDGGDGNDGQSGDGMDDVFLKTKFKSPVKFWKMGCSEVEKYINRIKDYTVTTLEDFPNMDSSYYLRRMTSNGMEITYNHDNWIYGSMSAVFLCKGSFGKPGLDGGENGLGGEGGYGGEIFVFHEDVVVKSNKGENGELGESGFMGKPGKAAWDIGYSDHCNWRVPVYSGIDMDSKLTIRHYSGSASDRTWCNRHKSYIKIENSDKLITSSTSKQQRQKQCQQRINREAQASAVNQKMVSKIDIQSTYQAYMESSRQCLDGVQFSAQIENLQQNIETLQEEQDETTHEDKLNIQVQRDATFEEVVKVKKIVFDRRIEKKINVKLFDPQGNFKTELLPQIHLLHFEPEDICELINFVSDKSFKASKIFSEEKKLRIEHIALSNYRQMILINIADNINSKLEKQKYHSLLPIERYFEKTVNKSEISDENLNLIDDYINDDTQISRKQIIEYCKEILKSNASSKLVQPAMEIFLNSCDTSILEGKYKDSFEKHINALQIFEVQKHMKVDMQIENFKTQIEMYPELMELWQKYEDGNEERNIFDEELKKFSHGAHFDLTERQQVEVAYEKIHSEVDAQFNWENCTNDNDFMDLFYSYIQSHGLDFNGYLQLLADIFSVRLAVYSLNEESNIVWMNSFNLLETREISILRNHSDKFEIITINYEFLELETQRHAQGTLFNKVLWELSQKYSKTDIDSYFNEITCGEPKINHSSISLNCPCEENDIMFILSCVESKDPAIKLESGLRSIKSQIICPNIILHLLARRFSYECCCVSDQEIMFLINEVLQSYLKNTQEIPLIQRIVASEPQKNWMAELTLLHIQNYYKMKFTLFNILRKNLIAIQKRELLLLFNIQLRNTPEDAAAPVKTIFKIFQLLKEVKIIPHQLYVNDIGNWLYVLERAYWHGRLFNFFQHDTEDNLNTATYYVQKLENYNGKKLLDSFLTVLSEKGEFVDSAKILQYLSLFVSEVWRLDNENVKQCEQVQSKDDLINWERSLSGSVECSGHIDRDMLTLIKIIENSANSSNALKDLLTNLHAHIISDGYKSKCEKVQKRESTQDLKIPSQISDGIASTLEVLSLIDQCIFLKRNFRLRDTQKLSVMMLLCNESSNLLQVSTGEGKSLIVVAVSIIKAFRGEMVDVITSSSVLAKRDALANKDIYDCFEVSVYHNCDDQIERRIKAYSSNKVIYGDITGFQRDFLLDRFYGKNILGDRNFANIVVDEVDSMLLDKGNNMLYLTHELPWLDKLTSVYIFIWKWLNQPASSVELLKYIFDETVLKEKVLHDLFGFINKRDILELDTNLRDGDLCEIWKILTENEFINMDGTIKIMRYELLDTLFREKYPQLVERLQFAFSEIEKREKSIYIPNYLKKFVVQHLDSWIVSAQNAFFMKEKENYIVDVNRTENNFDLSPNIIIIDRDTGTDEVNSQYDEALHQFLQLKHGCKLSAQSLKAVFVSNISYFKKYNKLYGLTGTLGSKRERNLLEEIHKVDFVTMPTTKPKKFIEYSPITCSDRETWIEEIKKEVSRVVESSGEKRSVLMICESVQNVEMLRKCFRNEKLKLLTYTRDYEDFDFSSGKALQTGHLLISTNLAGRGTDIKIAKDLVENGGLHVILTFLPGNSRIEQQAFGRSARCGEPGSARIIFYNEDTHCKNVILLKRERDEKELERISDIKKHYEMSILVQEKCFQLFQNFYLGIKDNLEFKLSWLDGFSKIISIKSLNKPTLMDIVDQKLRARNTKAVNEIVLQSFLDEWAYWLDSKTEQIGKIKTKRDYDDMCLQAKQFIEELKSRKTHIDMVKNNPSALIKLAKQFVRIKKIQEAKTMLDEVIEKEPNFSEFAKYYKAVIIGDNKKWKNTNEFLQLLSESKNLFIAHSNMSYMYAAAVNNLKKKNNSKFVQVDSFNVQQKYVRDIYEVYINSIDDVLGHAIDASIFVSDVVSDKLCEKLYQKLTADNIISKPSLQFLKEENEALRKIAKAYAMNYEELKYVLLEHGSFLDERRLSKEVNKLQFPSREKFWKMLKYLSILQEEVSFYEINAEELKKYDKIALNILLKKYISSDVFTKEDMNSLSMFSLSKEGLYLTVKECKDIFTSADMERYVAYNILKKNKKAILNRELLKHTRLPEYSSITIDDLTAINIAPFEAERILKDIEDQAYIQYLHGSYVLKDHAKDISRLDLKEFPVYKYALRSLLSLRFCYQIAANKLIADPSIKNLDFTLISNVNTALLVSLAEEEIISQSRVTYNGDLQLDNGEVDGFYRYLPVELHDKKMAKYILHLLQQSRSVLESLKAPEARLQNILENFQKPNNELLSLLNSFILNGLDEVLTFREEKYTREMISNTICVIVLGMVQLMFGVTLNYFSMGFLALVGNGFIKEGFNDLMFAKSALYSGYFSWAHYRKQKIVNLTSTCITFAASGLLTKGASVLRIGSKYISTASVGESAVKSSGSAFFESIKSITSIAYLKECSHNVARMTVNSMAYELFNSMEDSLLNNFARQYCESLAEKLLQDVNQSVEKHNISLLLEKAYRVLGASRAKRILSELEQDFFSAKNVENSFYQHIKSITNIFVEKIDEFKKESRKVQAGSKWLKTVMRGLSYIKKTCKILELRHVTGKLLDDMELQLREKINMVDPEKCTSVIEEGISFEKFKHDVTEMWQRSLNKHVGDYLHFAVVCPILKKIRALAVNFAKQAVKTCSSWRSGSKENESSVEDLVTHRNRHNEKFFVISEEISTSLQKHNDQLQMEAMAKSRDPKEIADIYRAGSQFEMTGILAVQYLIEEKQCKLNLIVRDDKNCTYSIESSKDGTAVTVELDLITCKHFCNSSGIEIKGVTGLGQNDCVYTALSAYFDLGSPEEFRENIAKKIEGVPSLRNFVESGAHGEYLRRGFHGGFTGSGRQDKIVKIEDDSGNDEDKQIEKFGSYPCKEDLKGSKKRKGRPCKACHAQEPTKTVMVPGRDKPDYIHGRYNCESTHCIYEVECKVCGKRYEGKCITSFRKRVTNHRRDVRKQNNKTLSEHAKTHQINKFDDIYRTRIIKQLKSDQPVSGMQDLEQECFDKYGPELNKIRAKKEPEPKKNSNHKKKNQAKKKNRN